LPKRVSWVATHQICAKALAKRFPKIIVDTNRTHEHRPRARGPAFVAVIGSSLATGIDRERAYNEGDAARICQDRPASGYDMRTVAAEIHSAVEALALTAGGPVDVVGHDIGSWICYAYAAEWPDDVNRLAVFERGTARHHPSTSAGIPSAEPKLKTWHFAFNRLDDLPEILLQGRERCS
jgi:pimeloyl-ACP methyl ester carboxylesterase